jgi:spermidine/putrescine transport system substrate-binding protein
MLTKRAGLKLATALAALMVVGSAEAAEKLRLLTWADYVPKDVMEQFTKETGIEVEVTLSNNEEMISKLRATQGAGFDLVQPSQDRIAGPQAEFGIYKPLDMSKVKSDQFIASMLEATKKNTTVDGKVYGVPHIWGTDGLIVNTKAAPKVADYNDPAIRLSPARPASAPSVRPSSPSPSPTAWIPSRPMATPRPTRP